MIATYEYQCEKCKFTFEVRRDWNVPGVDVQCPTCSSTQVFRLYSPVMTVHRGADGSRMTIGGGCGSCSATSCRGCASAKN